MSKFSNTILRPTSPIVTATVLPDTRTGNGARAWSRDVKSELFVLAVQNMVGEDAYYEKADARDKRFAGLVQQATMSDPDWVERLIPWLRNTANMRSASLVAAAEYCRAGGTNKRKVIDSAMSRADEPAEFIGYWQSATGSKSMGGGVKRGVADAVARLYNERSVLRYDSDEHAIRMGDVVELVHPRAKAAWQHSLFGYLLDKRHHKDEKVRVANAVVDEIAAEATTKRDLLPLLKKYHALMGIPQAERRQHLAEATEVFSWEQLSGWLNGPMDKAAWESMIPHMGYMALLRNLRNFDQANVSDDVAERVQTKLRDPEEVARSRQLPMRFYSAWNAAKSLRWGSALERALSLSLQNVPKFSGKTLILIDLSGSMYTGMSSKSQVHYYQLACLFGAAMAKSNDSEAFVYSKGHARVNVGSEVSVLRAIDEISHWSGAGGGTPTFQTLAATFDPAKHARIVILTDEQADPHGQVNVPTSVPIYTFSLAGYAAAQLPNGSANRYAFAGLSDSIWQAIPLLEQHKNGGWPF